MARASPAADSVGATRMPLVAIGVHGKGRELARGGRSAKCAVGLAWQGCQGTGVTGAGGNAERRCPR
jgi:hypothetical protein